TSECSGYYVQQRPWTPTKRRGPIAAEFVTPGPAAFNIPTTFGPKSNDARKVKSPAFSFGIKIDEKIDTSTPGPGEYEVEGVTKSGKDWSQAAFISPKLKEAEPFITPGPGEYEVEGVTKSGKDWSQAAFISPKLKEAEPFITPPPGAYDPQKSFPAVKVQAPSYTFGAKLKDVKNDNTPSPCEYNTDKGVNQLSTHQQPPNFTIGLKLNSTSTENIPGPGDYNVPTPDTYKQKKPPSYTLSYRTTVPGDKTRKPSPTEYQTEKVRYIKFQHSEVHFQGLD
ncbi:outer dense fiber protein 3-like protein, partial [Leptotrombidium deliense]